VQLEAGRGYVGLPAFLAAVVQPYHIRTYATFVATILSSFRKAAGSVWKTNRTKFTNGFTRVVLRCVRKLAQDEATNTSLGRVHAIREKI
jgi:hypothetical protein